MVAIKVKTVKREICEFGAQNEDGKWAFELTKNGVLEVVAPCGESAFLYRGEVEAMRKVFAIFLKNPALESYEDDGEGGE